MRLSESLVRHHTTLFLLFKILTVQNLRLTMSISNDKGGVFFLIFRINEVKSPFVTNVTW